MREELELHFELQVRELERSGLSAEDARRIAVHRFGGIEVVKEAYRDARGVRPLEDLMQDVRVGLRSLGKNPGFTAVAVITLAIGIGATTAIFSVVNGVLLRPLPYPDASSLVVIRERARSGEDIRVAAPNFLDWHQQSRSFTGLALYQHGVATVLGGDEPVRSEVAGVSQDFFRVLGLRPALGRTFTPDEFLEGGPPAVVISYDFWQEKLLGDRALSGHQLRTVGKSYQVVGVMPPGFHFPDKADVWIPVSLAGASADGRNAHNWEAAVGRLRDGVDVARARSEVTDIQGRIKAQYGAGVDAVGANVNTMRDEIVGPTTQPLLLLLGAAVLVLLIACANLGSTLLARGTARERELAVRAALGAGQRRLVRQLLTENVLLASLGAVAGLLVASLLVRALIALAPSTIPRVREIHIDGTVLAFTVLVSLTTALLFGLFPALRLARSDPARVLTTGSRGNTSGVMGRRWSLLVGIEVALALVLLVGAGLLIRSFRELLDVNPGFRSANVLTMDLALPESDYPDDAALRAFYQELFPALGAIPGVQSVGVTNVLPIEPSFLSGSFEIEGRAPDGAYSDYRVASGGYFRALGIPVIGGRLFTNDDRASDADVAIVNQALADRYWPGETAIGKRIRNLANDNFRYGAERWLTVIGVVGNVRQGALNGRSEPTVFVDYAQRPFRTRYASVVVRTTVPPAGVASAVRARLRAIGPNVPAKLIPMDARIGDSVAGRRFLMSVLGFFAQVALVLAGVGIYGVISYQVAQRTREIGVRLALGAGRHRVLQDVIRQGLVLTILGLTVGVLAALALTRVLSNLLYGVSAGDPLTFAAVILLLVAVALVATCIPALRATRVDPLVAMRAG